MEQMSSHRIATLPWFRWFWWTDFLTAVPLFGLALGKNGQEFRPGLVTFANFY
jgi:hypothetical protein